MTDEALISQVAALERKTDLHSKQLGIVSRAVEELHADVKDIKVGLFGDKLKDPEKKGLIEQVLDKQKEVDARHKRENGVAISVCRGFAWAFGIALATTIGFYTQQAITRRPADRAHTDRHVESQATIPRDVATEPPDGTR